MNAETYALFREHKLCVDCKSPVRRRARCGSCSGIRAQRYKKMRLKEKGYKQKLFKSRAHLPGYAHLLKT